MFENDSKVQIGSVAERVARLKEFELAATRFKFINEHYGLKRGLRHVLLGTQGTGKSTLARSILLDLCKQHRVLLYSSEETQDQLASMFALRGVVDSDLKNLRVVHEKQILERCNGDVHNQTLWEQSLRLKIFNSRADVLFFDNITTSEFYDCLEPEKQKSLLLKLQRTIERFNIPVFMVAHTRTGVKDDQQALISGDDVRGYRGLTNKAEFVYVYQRFMIPGGSHGADVSMGLVIVRKGRGLSNINSVYALDFDFDRREYFGDRKISLEEFNQAFKSKFTLGR